MTDDVSILKDIDPQAEKNLERENLTPELWLRWVDQATGSIGEPRRDV